MDDDLLSIGRFARLTGLSVGALRHYDELGLLHPADTDRFTGYRRYRRAQLETARRSPACATSRCRSRRSGTSWRWTIPRSSGAGWPPTGRGSSPAPTD